MVGYLWFCQAKLFLTAYLISVMLELTMMIISCKMENGL